MGGKFIPGIYHINYTVMKYMIGSGFSTEIYMNGYGFSKNGGCFENLSGTSVPKSIGRPPGSFTGLNSSAIFYMPVKVYYDKASSSIWTFYALKRLNRKLDHQ
jgi:hypothetical protein